jgi:ABC-type antimicrobial peptide transport system permease subunit
LRARVAMRSVTSFSTATDPISFGGTALVLAVITVLAGCVPAGRANGVDPIVALRGD